VRGPSISQFPLINMIRDAINGVRPCQDNGMPAKPINTVRQVAGRSRTTTGRFANLIASGQHRFAALCAGLAPGFCTWSPQRCSLVAPPDLELRHCPIMGRIGSRERSTLLNPLEEDELSCTHCMLWTRCGPQHSGERLSSLYQRGKAKSG
jgi:hypothetical protein